MENLTEIQNGNQSETPKTADLSQLQSQGSENLTNPQDQTQEPKKRGPYNKRGPRFKDTTKPQRAAQVGGSESRNASSQANPGDQSSPISLDNSQPVKLSAKDKAALIEIGVTLFTIAAALVAGRIAKHPAEIEAGIFVPSEEEAEAIATPAVSIISKQGIGSGVGDSNAGDFVNLAVGLASYLGNHFRNRATIRAAIRQAQAAQHDQQQQQSQDPAANQDPAAGASISFLPYEPSKI